MSAKVCVVIPVYNVGNKIIRCVESILFGEYKDINIILIDDCSNDDSWDYCVTLSNKYDKVVAIQNAKNSGVSFTRNRGIELADGQYIVFVDSDDWVSKSYLKELVESAKAYPGTLSMCGIRFIDEVNNNRCNYLWKSNEEIIRLPKKNYFSLVGGFFIQTPWNKIFELDIIKNNNLRFDINQSMGEDFQFVLDYLECLDSDFAVIINKPLYYYLRYSDTSLMGSFGIKEKNHEFRKRIEQLYRIIGIQNSKVDSAYQQTLVNTLNSYVYNISRNKSITDDEKIKLIEHVMSDGKAKKHFREQKKLIKKEKIYAAIHQLKIAKYKIIAKIGSFSVKRKIKKSRLFLNNDNFSIISQNCIGGVIYNDLGLKFLSPTINLYFSADDFVKFVLNLKYYISLEIEINWGEEYPIGILDDITIHFMNYSTCSEAKDAWDRRKERINYEKIIVLSTDMEGFDDDTYKLWKQIPYPKVLLSAKQWNDDSCVFLEKYADCKCVPDLIPRREFYKDNYIINKINTI